MGSETISDLFCEVVVLQILEFGGNNIMENSLRMSANYTKSCIEIAVNWRHVGVCYLKGLS